MSNLNSFRKAPERAETRFRDREIPRTVDIKVGRGYCMTNSHSPERRRYKRYSFREQVVFHCAGTSISCEMVDISLAGARLVLAGLPHALNNGTLESDRFGRFHYIVRYRSESDGSAGIEFQLTDAERTALGEKLETLDPI